MSCTILCRTTSLAPRWETSIPSMFLQDLLDDDETRGLAVRQVDLRHIPVHDRLRAEPETREEHLHLLWGRVLRLVQDDERVVQSSSPHESQGRDLDGPAFQETGQRVGAHHLEERVVERLHVRIDLLVQRSRQEAEAFARLDGGPRQDQTRDLLLLERSDGRCDREIGLARSGRTDRERDRRVAHRIDVSLLPEGLRGDPSSASGEQHVAEHLGRRRLLALDQLDRAADRGGVQLVSPFEQRDQLLEEQRDALDLDLGAGDGDLVAAYDDLRIERGLDELQQLVALAEEGDHALVPGTKILTCVVALAKRLALGWCPVPPRSSSVALRGVVRRPALGPDSTPGCASLRAFGLRISRVARPWAGRPRGGCAGGTRSGRRRDRRW